MPPGRCQARMSKGTRRLAGEISRVRPIFRPYAAQCRNYEKTDNLTRRIGRAAIGVSTFSMTDNVERAVQRSFSMSIGLTDAADRTEGMRLRARYNSDHAARYAPINAFRRDERIFLRHPAFRDRPCCGRPRKEHACLGTMKGPVMFVGKGSDRHAGAAAAPVGG